MSSNKKNYSQSDKENLRLMRSLITSKDPYPVLVNYLGAGNFKTSANGIRYSYSVNTRNDKSDSANVFLQNAEWKYNVWGDSSRGGSIIDFIKEEEDYSSVKDAMVKAAELLGIENLLDKKNGAATAVKEETRQEKLKRTHSILEEQRKANRATYKNGKLNHKITSCTEIKDNEDAIEFVKNRGLNPDKVPPGMYAIGFYHEKENKDGEVYKSKGFGVGIIIGGLNSFDPNNFADARADVHLKNPIKDKTTGKVIIKAKTVGNKDITVINSKYLGVANSNKLAIFESKFDYWAAYEAGLLKDTHVMLLNGASVDIHATKDIINLKNCCKKFGQLLNVTFFNQGDKPSIDSVIKIATKSGLDAFGFIRYEKDELKDDINDLHKKGKSIAMKISKQSNFLDKKDFGNLVYFHKNLYEEEDLEKLRKTLGYSMKQDLSKLNNMKEIVYLLIEAKGSLTEANNHVLSASSFISQNDKQVINNNIDEFNNKNAKVAGFIKHEIETGFSDHRILKKEKDEIFRLIDVSLNSKDGARFVNNDPEEKTNGIEIAMDFALKQHNIASLMKDKIITAITKLKEAHLSQKKTLETSDNSKTTTYDNSYNPAP